MRFFYFILALGIFFCTVDSAFAKHKYHNKVHYVTKVRSRAVVPAIYGAGQLANELNAIVNSDSSAAIAVYVKSMQGGQILYSRNIHEPLTPASTLKIMTAEAALLYLGPEYRFSTQLLTDAKSIKNGMLQGNLYVVLSGDPSLTYNDLVDLMVTLKNQDIQGITGNVYIDNTAYDQSFYGPGWEWKDKNYCYAAPISASIINHNCIPIKIAPARAGQAAQVVTSPKYFYPAIRNSVITKNFRSRACSLRMVTDANSTINIDGCMPVGHYAWGISYVVTEVPEYNRALFKSVLRQMGVKVVGQVTFGTAPQYPSMIGSHASKPLRLLINDMLKKSDNIIAGALFKKIGQLYTHRQGSWGSGSFAVTQILSKRAGVDVRGLRVLDGSGLSAANLTTPAQMMQVLDFAYHHYGTSLEFISALPISGVDGTLKHRMGNIARKIRAKTGTISGVRTLAGYAVSAEKEPLAFVIMINGSKGMGWKYKDLEDKIATALTRYRRYG